MYSSAQGAMNGTGYGASQMSIDVRLMAVLVGKQAELAHGPACTCWQCVVQQQLALRCAQRSPGCLIRDASDRLNSMVLHFDFNGQLEPLAGGGV